MSALGSSVRQLLSESNSTPLPQYVAADGNNANPYAAASAINNLSNVTITNANLTASEIPALNYLSSSGGSLSGSLSIGGNATTTGTSYFGGNVGIGTSTSQDALAVNGSEYLPDISAPGLTTNRLYANSGSLYWAGNLIAGAGTGNWTSDGTNVWRTGGNIGVGTTSPSLLFPSSAAATSRGASPLQEFTAATSTFTNATSTNLAVSGIASTSNLVASNSFTFGSLTGILHAVAGVVSTSLVNLASDVTGVLPVANGGTGWAILAAGAILWEQRECGRNHLPRRARLGPGLPQWRADVDGNNDARQHIGHALSQPRWHGRDNVGQAGSFPWAVPARSPHPPYHRQLDHGYSTLIASDVSSYKVTDYYAYGNSITYGSGASSPAKQYVNIIATHPLQSSQPRSTRIWYARPGADRRDIC